MSSTVLISLLFSYSILTPVSNAESYTESKITAKAISGGTNVSVDDVDFGKIVIGKKIEDKSGNLIVTDRTGGNGWNLSVKSNNFESIKDEMSYSISLMEDSKLISNDDSNVLSGQPSLDSQEFTAKYGMVWGIAPKANQLTNELTWTLTPHVRTMADNFKDDVTFGYLHIEEPFGTELVSDVRTMSMPRWEDSEFMDLDGSHGKLNSDGVLEMSTDLRIFKQREDEPFDSDYIKENYLHIWLDKFEELGITSPKISKPIEWITTSGMGTELYSDLNDKGYYDLIVEDDLSYAIDEDGYFIATGNSMAPNDLLTTISEYPTVEQKVKLRFIDGSELKFTYRHTFYNAPLKR